MLGLLCKVHKEIIEKEVYIINCNWLENLTLIKSAQSSPLQMDFSMPTKEFHEEATEYAISFAFASDTSKFEALSFSMLRPNLENRQIRSHDSKLCKRFSHARQKLVCIIQATKLTRTVLPWPLDTDILSR